MTDFQFQILGQITRKVKIFDNVFPDSSTGHQITFCGSTTDHLVRLESFVREAFAQRQHAVVVFFDLEKAYESTWKFGIMRDLHNAGLKAF